MKNAFVVELMIGAALSGCSLMEPASTSTPKVDLVGGTWVAEDIDGAGVIDDAQSTVQFGNDGRISGRGACNGYSGTVDLKGAQIIIGQLVSTKMACPPAVMDQENRFMAALQATRTYRMDEGDKLVFCDATGKPRLRFSR
jgi:putative lipoprotein